MLRVARLAGMDQRATTNDPSALIGHPQNLSVRSRHRHDGAAAMGAPPKKEGKGQAVPQGGPIGIRHGADEVAPSGPSAWDWSGTGWTTA